MTNQETTHHTPTRNLSFCAPAALVAALLLGLLAVNSAKAAPGDQWILLINHVDGSGFIVWPGAGYFGTDAYEYNNNGNSVGLVRVYWEMNGLSEGTGNLFPTTTELYTIEWYVPSTGEPSDDWQPIESQFHGSNGETYPNDPSIPWGGEYGTDHQYIGAEIGNNAIETWAATGPGPHTPQSSAYDCLGDSGTFMWLTSGSWLYAKWEFTFAVDHIWSALRLTQVSPVTFTSITKSGTTVNLTWVAIPGKNYQVQFSTSLRQPSWNNLPGGSVTATGGTASASDTNPTGATRYYQVALQP